MKKIINGKKYDTSTAKEIARWDNGDCLSFGWCSETLYRKKTGEYFLHGEGGPTSKYCEYSDGMQRSGEQIIPLTGGKKAREWAEQNLGGDLYEEIFGEVEE